MLLSQYIVQVRRLLNDAQRNYWTDQELTDYINEARNQTALDTLCCRKFQEANLIAGQERYQYTDILPNGSQTVDVINITIIWGNQRVQLGYQPFTRFSAIFRPWLNYRRLPAAFTVYNQSEFWIGYKPDQAYEAEFDTAVRPLALANDNTVDILPDMYAAAVKFYAASTARLKLQQYTEYEAMQKIYLNTTARLGAMPPRRIPYVFETDVY